jgi:hypothetical protein
MLSLNSLGRFGRSLVLSPSVGVGCHAVGEDAVARYVASKILVEVCCATTEDARRVVYGRG